MMLDDFYTPEDALRDHGHLARDPEAISSWRPWILWAADGVERDPECERCLVEELADTLAPEAAAIIMALPRRFAATVAALHKDRLQFRGYKARKALRAGRKLADLTPIRQRAVLELLEMDNKAGRELRELLEAE